MVNKSTVNKGECHVMLCAHCCPRQNVRWSFKYLEFLEKFRAAFFFSSTSLFCLGKKAK